MRAYWARHLLFRNVTRAPGRQTPVRGPKCLQGPLSFGANWLFMPGVLAFPNREWKSWQRFSQGPQTQQATMSRSFQSAAKHELTFYHYDIFKSLQVKMGPNQENCPSRKECLSSLIYYSYVGAWCTCECGYMGNSKQFLEVSSLLPLWVPETELRWSGLVAIPPRPHALILVECTVTNRRLDSQGCWLKQVHCA